MKKFALLLTVVIVSLCFVQAALGETGIVATAGSPVSGTQINLDFAAVDNGVAGTVRSCIMEKLDNGFTRFTLTYTVPAGLHISVFDPPDGNCFMMTDKTGTSAAESTLIFDLSASQMDAVSEITVGFSSPSGGSTVFWVYAHLPEPVSFGLTQGNPVGTQETVNYTVFCNDFANAQIYSVVKQELDNQCTRFTVDYQVPAGLSASVFNPYDEQNTMRFASGVASGLRDTLSFDVDNGWLQGTDTYNVAFFSTDGSGSSFMIGLQLTAAQSFVTNGVPVGDAKPVPYEQTGQLALGAGAVRSYTWQRLDNGYTRFRIEYTVPQGMKRLLFDPPEGNRFSYKWFSVTSGQDEALLFDVKNEDLAYALHAVFSFYSESAGTCWISFATETVLDIDVILPRETTAIESQAFAGTDIRSVLIWSGVTSIAPDAFDGCANLIIYGTAGSAAEDFAKQQGFTFFERLEQD